MTRFIHDQFAKDYCETLLTPLGAVTSPRRVNSEVREIDVYFVPNPQPPVSPKTLGLLGQMASTPCILEPFRNPVTPTEIKDCLVKVFEIQAELRRKANRSNQTITDQSLPTLWILTPTASDSLLTSFGATSNGSLAEGIYRLAPAFNSAIITIHQLSKNADTLWLRILGRGTVQKQAIDELEALTAEHPFRQATLELLYNLQQNLQATASIEEDDQELLMRLAPLYLQDRELAKQEGKQEGRQEGERLVVENLLRVRFGTLDPQLESIVEAVLRLPPEEFTPLLMQQSRQELLERFSS